MSQYLLDCEQDICSLTPYTAPPATVEYYSLAPTWSLLLVAVIVLAFILATAIVRYKAHQERGDTERQRILHPLQKCPTCGDELETEET
jgi:hypothetical protein